MMIPVFFLSFFPVSGQPFWKETYASSLGNTFMTRPGFSSASHNQASLGWLEQNTISFQHSRPFTIRDLGVSSISTQVRAGTGAFGAALVTFGITGLRQTDLWISYGMKLHQEVSAGVGIHCWTLSTQEKALHFPGVSFALGIQASLSDRLMIGAHVLHPAGWAAGPNGKRNNPMVIAAGFSWDFLQGVTYYSDLRFTPYQPLQTCHGLEMKLKERFEILLGLHNRPFSISGGISFHLTRWTLQVAIEWMTNSGNTPCTSLTYGW